MGMIRLGASEDLDGRRRLLRVAERVANVLDAAGDANAAARVMGKF